MEDNQGKNGEKQKKGKTKECMAVADKQDRRKNAKRRGM